MKVQEILVEGDVVNFSTFKLDHLDKAQKAASYQLWVYLTQLKYKYPKIDVPSWTAISRSSPAQVSEFSKEFSKFLTWLKVLFRVSLTDHEKAKLVSKYDNVIKAKQAYACYLEAAGGNYKEKLKEQKSTNMYLQTKICL